MEKGSGSLRWVPAKDKRLPVTLPMLVALMIVVLPCASLAQNSQELVKATEGGKEFEVKYTVRFSGDALQFEDLLGYTTARLRGSSFLKEPGKPMLPVHTLRIALPAGMFVTHWRGEVQNPVELPGEYLIYPAQWPKPITPDMKPRDFALPDPEIYGVSDAFPAQWLEFMHQADLAGQNMAVLRVHPLQYIPLERRLIFAPSVEIVLQGALGYSCGDCLPRHISEHGRQVYEKMLTQMVVNPASVAGTFASGPTPPSLGVEPGNYEYVIITHSNWVDDFQPLADWRTKKGMPAAMVTTEWIYNSGNYSGSNLQKIRAFVEDAHIHWGALYFLLGGDTNVIPYHTRSITIPGYWTDDIANDTYFADYDEDWVCEVHVGRISVRNISQINTFINKVFAYEKNPPFTDYATMAVFFGFDITDPGDQSGELAKDYIRSLHMPASWTLNTEYDSEPGAHKADVISYLNQGHHLVNHFDHCNTDCMGTGWISHGDLIFNSDVSALTNGSKQSLLFAVGCYPCYFPTTTSIAEAFVGNPNGGGISFIGNSCLGWGGPPEDPDHYSVQQDRFFYRNLFDDGFERLGENFSDLKNDEFDFYDPYNLHKYCFTQLHLQSDPGLTVWTEDPKGLTVTHDNTIHAGQPAAFMVQVESGGNPVDQATVCLWKDSDVYLIEQTASGVASFAFTPYTAGSLYVTVTKQNFLPYEGTVAVDNEIVIDDGDPQFGTLGFWAYGYYGKAYNHSLRYGPPGSGGKKAGWLVNTAVAPGTYGVYVWKFDHPFSHIMATNVHYRVFHKDGASDWILVDQSSPGDEWVHLGTFAFVDTRMQGILVHNECDGFIILDAVKLVYAGK